MKLRILLLFISLCYAAFGAVETGDLKKGVDLTGQSSVTAANLNNLVDAAVTGTNKGMIYRKSTRPDVTNNPRYTNWLWADLSGGTPLVKSYQGTGDGDTNWVSTALGVGSVNSTALGEASVIAGKIAANGVNTSNIVNSAVTDVKIAAGAINNSHLQSGSVSNANLAVTTIVGGYGGAIAYNTITGTNLIDAAVTLPKHANNSVNSNIIVDASIDTTDLKDQAITGAKIATNASMLLLPKVLCRYDGIAQNVRKLYNVSTVRSNSIGNYTVIFNTALADTNYIVSGSAMRSGSSRDTIFTVVTQSVGEVSLVLRSYFQATSEWLATNDVTFSVSVFGD